MLIGVRNQIAHALHVRTGISVGKQIDKRRFAHKQ